MGAGLGVYVDSPVSGASAVPTNGTLSFVVGHTEPLDNDLIPKTIVETLYPVGEVSITNTSGG